MALAPLALTPGMGIGPEVSLRALREDPHPVVLIGRASAIWAANRALGLPLQQVGHESEAESGRIPVIDADDGAEAAEVSALRVAVAGCQSGRFSALVTGPIHKKRLRERGFAYNGHTDFLGHLLGAEREVMAFVGGSLRVALVTTHIPLSAVPAALRVDDIERVVRVAHAALVDDLGLTAPRIYLCGVNPHAGEEGLLGDEVLRIIGPAADALRAEGYPLIGPVSAETAFLEGRAGRADLIVAMYHDQGLAPLKAVDFGRSVNWTLGLPIIRTSVDHGTADALVGTGLADPASMRAALGLAAKIVSRRVAGAGARMR